jgi:hypothetical protein
MALRKAERLTKGIVWSNEQEVATTGRAPGNALSH